MLWAFIFALVCAGVCPPVDASIWRSGQVVYVTGDNLTLMESDGQTIYSSESVAGAELGEPTWAPNGWSVLFTADFYAGPEIMLWDLDNPPYRVVDGAHPSWAPDGERFVYTSDRELYIGDLGDIDNPTHIRTEIDNPQGPVRPPDGKYIADPAWSPDGKYIAYVVVERLPAFNVALYVYDVAANRSWEVFRPSPPQYIFDPTWDPRSSLIVFEMADGSYLLNSSIYWVELVENTVENTNPARLVCTWPGPGSALTHPTVAPYGGEVIVAREDLDTLDGYFLYKFTVRTNSWQQLTEGRDADWWHPSAYSVEPGALQLSTTWGSLKKQVK